jgi:hypothetical protein
MKQTILLITLAVACGCATPQPKGSVTLRCRPVVQGWPLEDKGNDFVAGPVLYLAGSNTNVAIHIWPIDAEFLSLLNTNEVYDFTIAKYESRGPTLNLGRTFTIVSKGQKVIKVQQDGRLIYKDFKDLVE